VSVLPGHEDLKPREILNMTAVVKMGDGTMEYKLFVGSGGIVMAEPIQQPLVDQIAPSVRTPVAHRWATVDQQLPRQR